MSLISLVVTLIVIGVLLWLVNSYIPMDGKIKNILNIVVVICVVVWLLYAFGVLGRAGDIRVPQVRAGWAPSASGPGADPTNQT